MSHVEVRIVDEHGVLVPNADRLLEFELEGPGRLMGVDNGDLECEEPYQGKARTSRSGRCLAIVQVGRRPGTLDLTVKAADLPAARIALISL